MPALLETVGISKQFGRFTALDNFDLRINAGEIHAILGENGAGKSTLMNILYGVMPASAGSVVWRGKEIVLSSPAQARSLGIGMVFQHFSLFDTLTVAENLRLTLSPIPSPQLFAGQFDALMLKYGLRLDPDALIATLSAGQKQSVEIARCLLQNTALLILDEPTSVLAPTEIESLLQILRRLAEQGCAILFISHKLQEVRRLCHRATILRAGKRVQQCVIADTNSEQLAEMMFGTKVQPAVKLPAGLSAQRLRLYNAESHNLQAINLVLAGGQILGVAGIAGNGQEALLSLISGESKLTSGQLLFNELDIGSLGVRQRRKLGIDSLPVDRLEHGAIASLSLSDNNLLSRYDSFSGFMGCIKRTALNQNTQAIIARFKVATSGYNAPAGSLSGGNLQKFLMGRALQTQPKVFVCYNPTWGVDMAAATAIHQHLLALRDAGAIVVVISEDLDELLVMSDRITAINSGQLCEPVDTAALNIQQLSLWMTDAAKSQQSAPSAEPNNALG